MAGLKHSAPFGLAGAVAGDPRLDGTAGLTRVGTVGCRNRCLGSGPRIAWHTNVPVPETMCVNGVGSGPCESQ
ncbi:hypothetical protein GCM10027610_023640 [Dactylosporangium cerinum]